MSGCWEIAFLLWEYFSELCSGGMEIFFFYRTGSDKKFLSKDSEISYKSYLVYALSTQKFLGV
jgi:hypothetical protein